MTYDFLIIGGGIAGLSAAARLAPLGSTLVLEAEPALAYHASGRSAALFEENYGNAPTVALNRASRAYLEAAGTLTPRGLLFVGGPGDEAQLARDIESFHLTALSPEEAQAHIPVLDPTHVIGAGYHAAALDLDADLLVQGFAKEARKHGAQIATAARVTEITRNDGLWQVSAGDTHAAHNIVNAAGAWADQIAAMAGVAPLGLIPLRRSMARMPAPGGHDPSGWPMIIGTGETWYAKPDAGKWLVSPAEEDPVDTPHDAWADDMVIAEGIARYQPFVTEEVTRVDTTWAGFRTFAPDRTLVIGPDANLPSFLWLAGQGGYGMQSAPAASALLADLVAGRAPALEPEIVAALSPARFTA